MNTGTRIKVSKGRRDERTKFLLQETRKFLSAKKTAQHANVDMKIKKAKIIVSANRFNREVLSKVQ